MKRVLWCYGIHQHYLITKLHAAGYETHTGILLVDKILQSYGTVVLDDLLLESKTSDDVTSMFTRAAYHKPCLVISITQYLFPERKCTLAISIRNITFSLKSSRHESVASDDHRIRSKNVKLLTDIFEAARENTICNTLTCFNAWWAFHKTIFEIHVCTANHQTFIHLASIL